MNRKFRAWYKPDFKTEEGPMKFIQEETEDHEVLFVMEGDKEFCYGYQIPFLDDDWIVEEYTGVDDKNGTPIYEGDIVKVPNKLNKHIFGEFSERVVKWKPDSFTWVLDGEWAWMTFVSAFGEEGEFIVYNDEDITVDVEVVSNIYEKVT